MSKTNTDTITISRDLFERLCEAAIMADEYHQWLREMSGVIDDDDDCEWKQLRNEALAIRDGGKK